MELAITTAIESLGRQQPSFVVHRPLTVALLFDHLVGAGEQRRRHFEAEQPGGLKIDH
jgi:hypothetical protein